MLGYFEIILNFTTQNLYNHLIESVNRMIELVNQVIESMNQIIELVNQMIESMNHFFNRVY